MSILESRWPNVEVYSIDEAWLDLSGFDPLPPLPEHDTVQIDNFDDLAESLYGEAKNQAEEQAPLISLDSIETSGADEGDRERAGDFQR